MSRRTGLISEGVSTYVYIVQTDMPHGDHLGLKLIIPRQREDSKELSCFIGVVSQIIRWLNNKAPHVSVSLWEKLINGFKADHWVMGRTT